MSAYVSHSASIFEQGRQVVEWREKVERSGCERCRHAVGGGQGGGDDHEEACDIHAVQFGTTLYIGCRSY